MSKDYLDSGLIAEVIRLSHHGLELLTTSRSEPHDLFKALLASSCIENLLFSSSVDIDMPFLKRFGMDATSVDVLDLVISGQFQVMLDLVGKENLNSLRSQLADYFKETLTQIGVEGLK